MNVHVFLFAQAGDIGAAKTIFETVLQSGMAGVVLAAFLIMVWYLRHRDDREERAEKSRSESLGKLSSSVDSLKDTLARLDTLIRDTFRDNKRPPKV